MPEPRIRVAGILRQGETVLFVEHTKGNHSYWLLPGGGVEYGETLENALHREMLEECNLDVEVGPLVLVCDSIAPNRAKHVVSLCFEVTVKAGDLQVGDDPRLTNARFVPIDEVQALALHPAIQAELVEALQSESSGGARYVRTQWV